MVFLWSAVLYAVANSPAETVAAVAAFLFAARCITMVVAVGSVIKISPWSLLRAIRGGILLTLIMVVISFVLKAGIADLNMNAQAKLFLMLGAGVSAYLISFFLLASILVDAPLAAWTLHN